MILTILTIGACLTVIAVCRPRHQPETPQQAWNALDESLRMQIGRSARKIVLDFEVAFTDTGLERLRRLQCPVRLLSGGRSRVPAQRVVAFLAEQIPGATLEIVDDANHLLPVTHPDLLREWLLRELPD